METIYDVSYFIKKFQAIHDDLWLVGNLEDGYGSRCAVGHCQYGKEREALWALFPDTEAQNDNYPETIASIAPRINDGLDSRYKQPTPKQRILAALYDIKKMQQSTEQPKEKVVYKTVVIDSAVKGLQESLSVN